MKKLEMMMLMLLVAFMGMTLQSCGSDDDGDVVSTFYLSADLTDEGTLPTEEVSVLKATLIDYKSEIKASLALAKAALDKAVNDSKSAFASQEGYKYTLTFFLKDTSGNIKYSKKVVVNGNTVTIQ